MRDGRGEKKTLRDILLKMDEGEEIREKRGRRWNGEQVTDVCDWRAGGLGRGV